MRGWVPGRGKFVKVEDVPRGRPVLRPAKEWHDRSVSLRVENRERYFLFYALLVYPLYLGIWLALGGPIWLGFTNATIYLVIYSLMGYAMEVYQSNRELARDNYSGLFEYGLQIRMNEMKWFFFIPYCDILDFRVTEGIINQILFIDLKGWKKPFKVWGFPEILGEDGLEELRRRIGSGLVPAEMPKLVLYAERTPAVLNVPSQVEGELRSPSFSAPLRF